MNAMRWLIPLLCMLVASRASAAPYSVIDLGVLPGGVSSTATSVDNGGEVVGYTTYADNSTQAFYWTQSGGMVGLGGTNSKAYSVNNGNVVGSNGLGTSLINAQAFRWNSSTGMVLLDPTNIGQANGVNNSGKVVGDRKTGSGNIVLTWSSTNSLSNPFPIANLTGTALNNLGQFVGVSNNSTGYYNDGISSTRVSLGSLLPTSISDNRYAAGAISQIAAFEKIDTLATISIGTLSGDITSKALGINPLGTDIVGFSNGHGGFLYDIATSNLQSLTLLLDPAYSGWSIDSGNAINDHLAIAGAGTFAGAQHAVLLTVPEPGTVVLGGIGFVVIVGMWFWRQRQRWNIVIAPALVAILATSVNAAPYSVIDLGVLPGGISSTATSVDNDGEVVGYTTYADSTTQAFYWTQGGGMIGLGGTNSKAFGVNSGNVVGINGVGASLVNGQAFRWKSSTGIVLLDPTNLGQGNGVNSAGKVIGNRTASSLSHSVLTWSSTNALSNPFPTFNFTGSAINGLGQYVGVSNNVSGYYNDGISSTRVSLGSLLPTSLSDNRIAAGAISQIAAFEKIDTLSTISIGTLAGDLTSKALGINPLGTDIVGLSNGHGGFLYNIATNNLQSLTSLLDPTYSSWSVTSGNAINDQGHIAATASFGGVQHAVLLVPEPSTFTLAGITIVLLVSQPSLAGTMRRRTSHAFNVSIVLMNSKGESDHV